MFEETSGNLGSHDKSVLEKGRWSGGVLLSCGQKKKIGSRTKTYNRRDSQMVTHSSTSRPVQCLCMAERTGCPVLTDLWSYVLICNRRTI
jgi:hypothetical protein